MGTGIEDLRNKTYVTKEEVMKVAVENFGLSAYIDMALALNTRDPFWVYKILIEKREREQNGEI